MTLPLSYSRIHDLRHRIRTPFCFRALLFPLTTHPRIPIPNSSNGGEGRTRTFEAARATDLQSAAFDRFATSPLNLSPAAPPRGPAPRRSPPSIEPAVIRLAHLSFQRGVVVWNEAQILELAKGFEPPTR